MTHTGVVLLGGLGMNARALHKVAAAIYPGLAVKFHVHTANQLLNVRSHHKTNADAVARSIHSFPGGCALHMVSGSAFFAIPALASGEWGSNVKTVVLDSIPFARREAALMRTAGLPEILCKPMGAIASSVLNSEYFGATDAFTDRYFELLCDAKTYSSASRVLVACSIEDSITPISDARLFAEETKKKWSSAAAARPHVPHLSIYEGNGKHACLARDDIDNFAPHIRSWLKSSPLELA